MKFEKIYSYLNDEEYVMARKPALWLEIQNVIANVDGEVCKSMVSQERSRQMSPGHTFYEKDLGTTLCQGRGIPGVPLVVLGVCAQAACDRCLAMLRWLNQTPTIAPEMIRCAYRFSFASFANLPSTSS